MLFPLTSIDILLYFSVFGKCGGVRFLVFPWLRRTKCLTLLFILLSEYRNSNNGFVSLKVNISPNIPLFYSNFLGWFFLTSTITLQFSISVYNQTGDISTLDGTPLKLVDKFSYLGSSVASTEKDIDTRLTKVWTAINRLSIIWKSDLTDKMKRSFFKAAVASILLYGCTIWTLTKQLEKKLDGNYTRMLRAILNKSWWQHPTRHQLYGHLPPITKTIQVRQTRHAGHCWRSRDELISEYLLWAPTHGRARTGRPARTYIQQLCEDTGCSPEDLPEAMKGTSGGVTVNKLD